MSSFLSAKDITKTYKVNSGEVRVVDGVSLDLAAGEVVSIVGPSGAGKSTLLHIFGLIETPTSGTLEFKGELIRPLDRAKAGRLRNSSFGFVFQFYHLIPELTVLENVLLPKMISTSFFGWMSSSKTLRAEALEMLDRVGMSHRTGHRPSQLSGGEKQRTAIARAVITRPEVLFCDEPTGNLDTKTSADIIGLLWDIKRSLGMSLVVVTHDLNIAAKADRQFKIVDGRFV